MIKNIVLITLMFVVFSCSRKAPQDVVVDQMINGNYNDSLQNYQEYINNTYQVFAMPLPNELNFAGDIIPLNKINVREKLDREILVNTYWHSNTFLYQKRAARWFPFIEKILAKNKMPDDLKYIALIESGLINVVSPAGATGFWQFMKPTAKGYGLVVNEYVDERYDLEKSTEAACKYLKKAHEEFGDWSLAAASYNMGKGGLKKQIEKQKVNSYFDLFLNKESSRYVYRILAAKLILSNSENFGFHFRPQEYYAPYSTYNIKVDSSINDLVQFSLDNGANYNLLRTLNPWIRGYKLPAKDNGDSYTIKFPKGDFNDTISITKVDTITGSEKINDTTDNNL